MFDLGGIPIHMLVAIVVGLIVLAVLFWGPTPATPGFANTAAGTGLGLFILGILFLLVGYFFLDGLASTLVIWLGWIFVVVGICVAILEYFTMQNFNGLFSLGLLGGVAAVLMILLLVGAVRWQWFSGSGDKGNINVVTTTDKSVQLESFVIHQDEDHTLTPVGNIKGNVGVIPDFVLKATSAELNLKYNKAGVPVKIAPKDQPDSVTAGVTDSNGLVKFPLDLSLSQGENSGEKQFVLTDKESVTFGIKVEQPISNGQVSSNMPNSQSELNQMLGNSPTAIPSATSTATAVPGVRIATNTPVGVVATSTSGGVTVVTTGVTIDPVFKAAFVEFCRFSPEGLKADLILNDTPRFQVSWNGSEFLEAQSQIAVGEPIWRLTSGSGEKCFINPPCGNPVTPPGKLPPAPPDHLKPPGKEVSPTPTSTRVPGTPVPPSPTNTPPVVVTATATTIVVVNTSTPTAVPTQTPQATFTPVGPCRCLTGTPVPISTIATSEPYRNPSVTPKPVFATPTQSARPTVGPPVEY